MYEELAAVCGMSYSCLHKALYSLQRDEIVYRHMRMSIRKTYYVLFKFNHDIANKGPSDHTIYLVPNINDKVPGCLPHDYGG